MDNYLKDLLERMAFKNQNPGNSNSISFLAHKEANNLANKEYIIDLINFIKSKESKKNKKIRENAYFILGKLLKKFNYFDGLQFFIFQLKIEKDKYILSLILDLLADIEKSEEIDIKPIIDFLNDKNTLIRHSAINALKKSKNIHIRDYIICIISTNLNLAKNNEKYDKNAIIYSNTIMYEVGKLEDIDFLESLKYLKKRDINGTVDIAIKYIKSRNEGGNYQFKVKFID